MREVAEHVKSQLGFDYVSLVFKSFKAEQSLNVSVRTDFFVQFSARAPMASFGDLVDCMPLGLCSVLRICRDVEVEDGCFTGRP